MAILVWLALFFTRWSKEVDAARSDVFLYRRSTLDPISDRRWSNVVVRKRCPRDAVLEAMLGHVFTLLLAQANNRSEIRTFTHRDRIVAGHTVQIVVRRCRV